jgi:hypothetical protein
MELSVLVVSARAVESANANAVTSHMQEAPCVALLVVVMHTAMRITSHGVSQPHRKETKI